MSVYIKSSAQISVQNPLCNDWAENPVFYKEPYIRCIEADYKHFVSAMASRRMGRIIKRAIAVSAEALSGAGIISPEAIITGTGLGCIENTELFLDAMIHEGEEFLQPAYFINSTHNTISSQVAIHFQCHGYNNTFSQRGISFESALIDAFMLFETGSVFNALVIGNDEMTPHFFDFFNKLNYWKKSSSEAGAFSGESAGAFILSTEKDKVEIAGIDILYSPDEDALTSSISNMCSNAGISVESIEAVMVGENTNSYNDKIYSEFCDNVFPNLPILWWKHIFGESFTSSALGLYVSDYILRTGNVPSNLIRRGHVNGIPLKNILIYNHFQNKEHSLILLKSC